MRRDLGNRASPVNRAHMKRPSDWIFVRINLNAYSDSARRTFVSKFSNMLFLFFEYVNHFFIDKGRAAHL